MIKRLFITFLSIYSFIAIGCKDKVSDQDKVSAPHVDVELISEKSALESDGTTYVGARFKMEKGWHLYWRNPGDTGLQPKLQFKSDFKGTEIGPVLWPYPKRFQVGPLVNFGYEDTLVLPAKVKIPSSAVPGEELQIHLSADWLICHEECIPGSAELFKSFSIANPGSATLTAESKDIDTSIQMLPVQLSDTSYAIEESNDRINLAIIFLKERFVPENVTFFPIDKGVIDNAGAQISTIENNTLKISLKRNQQRKDPISRLRGVLVASEGWSTSGEPRAVELDTSPSPEPVQQNAGALTPPAEESSQQGFLVTLLFAFLGGLILNLMPCVFPVLSIKVLSFVDHGEKDGVSPFRHALIFSLGVVVSFWILAGLLFVLRAGGEELGWGFQLQSPYFVFFMAVVFLFLSLMFLMDLPLGGAIQNAAGSINLPTSQIGSFFNGALATLVATPCTAPFMGSALAATVTMPAINAFLIFTMLGFGMSSPYLLLTASPKLLSFMPRPGEWMVVFKQAVAFPMLATVLWLCWVFAQQCGIPAAALNPIAALFGGLLLISFGLWVFSRVNRHGAPFGRWFLICTAVVFIVLGIRIGLPNEESLENARAQLNSSSDKPVPDQHGLIWEKFSESRLNQLIQEGRTIYVDFTAAWCITCQVNKGVVFGSEEVLNFIKQNNVALLRGDWTAKDIKITETLRKFGRNGVPLNLIFKSASQTPTVLPSVLTPDTVIEALK